MANGQNVSVCPAESFCSDGRTVQSDCPSDSNKYKRKFLKIQQECTTPPDGDPSKRFWMQKVNECPISTAPIDGGFSAWSEWFRCNQHTDDHRHESSNLDTCLCRTRVCNNPTPKNGGSPCEGTLIYDIMSFLINILN